MSLTLLDSYIVSMRFEGTFYPARTSGYECITENPFRCFASSLLATRFFFISHCGYPSCARTKCDASSSSLLHTCLNYADGVLPATMCGLTIPIMVLALFACARYVLHVRRTHTVDGVMPVDVHGGLIMKTTEVRDYATEIKRGTATCIRLATALKRIGMKMASCAQFAKERWFRTRSC
jgi:hypothetical protein